ncbi:MAG: hypothetical protein LBM27_03215 [Lactobacillaceae bacterium]|jgi:hypothetical protein|nr:hypothetical protein [Lactobacillaceae bacterium]
MKKRKQLITILLVVIMFFGLNTKNVFAEDETSTATSDPILSSSAPAPDVSSNIPDSSSAEDQPSYSSSNPDESGVISSEESAIPDVSTSAENNTTPEQPTDNLESSSAASSYYVPPYNYEDKTEQKIDDPLEISSSSSSEESSTSSSSVDQAAEQKKREDEEVAKQTEITRDAIKKYQDAITLYRQGKLPEDQYSILNEGAKFIRKTIDKAVKILQGKPTELVRRINTNRLILSVNTGVQLYYINHISETSYSNLKTALIKAINDPELLPTIKPYINNVNAAFKIATKNSIFSAANSVAANLKKKSVIINQTIWSYITGFVAIAVVSGASGYALTFGFNVPNFKNITLRKRK